MQFQVPQFIEIEDKIIGPLTLKQFLYLAAAGGIGFMLFFILQTWLWIIIMSIVSIFALGAAFIKINGRPLPLVILAAFKYGWQPKLYLWRREPIRQPLPQLTKIPEQKHVAEPLRDLWVKMNTTTTIIENREKPSPALTILKKPAEILERYEITRKQAGDRELYKRVDYR